MYQPTVRFRSLLGALLLGAALLPFSAAAQPGCVLFKNLVHCELGKADLQLAPGGEKLLVKSLGPAGTDGVSTEFDTATHWRAQMTVENPANVLTFQALLDGDTTASASFRMEHDGDPLVLETTFTGAAGPHSYRAVVFNGGEQVAVFDGLDEASSIAIARIPVPEPIPWPPWPGGPDFRRGPLGPCIWDFSFGESMRFTSSEGGQAVGDRIRLVENVGSGHYLYSGFSAITMQTDAGTLTITNEEIN